jgi:Tfp pilus assembly protein PilN
MARYVPAPPPDDGYEWRGTVKWPWFSARRRGHLLQKRVDHLEARLAWIERYLKDQQPRQLQEEL